MKSTILLLILTCSLFAMSKKEYYEANPLMYANSLFYSYNERYEPKLADSLKVDFTEFLDSYYSFDTLLIDTNSGPGVRHIMLSRKNYLARTINALTSHNNSYNEILKFIEEFPLAYETEGMSEVPLREANFIKEYIDTNPNSKILPTLYLLIVTRYCLAIEYLGFEKNEKEQMIVSELLLKYKNLGLKSKSILIRELIRHSVSRKSCCVNCAKKSKVIE